MPFEWVFGAIQGQVVCASFDIFEQAHHLFRFHFGLIVRIQRNLPFRVDYFMLWFESGSSSTFNRVISCAHRGLLVKLISMYECDDDLSYSFA